ncbi:hypothetical protein GA0004734_00031140 [Rhizobium sp. 9140]|nr:hypothetical protein GA0004734_00031140 [Rhizobium sp. 9140]
MRLPYNWDGYGGTAIGFGLATFVMKMLGSACPHGTRAPAIVPAGNGDVQVEWHTFEYDIELHVEAPFRVHACRVHNGEIEERLLTNEFSLVANWLREMEAAIAARTTAA